MCSHTSPSYAALINEHGHLLDTLTLHHVHMKVEEGGQKRDAAADTAARQQQVCVACMRDLCMCGLHE